MEANHLRAKTLKLRNAKKHLKQSPKGCKRLMSLPLAANNQATRRNKIIRSKLQVGSSSNRYAPRLLQQETFFSSSVADVALKARSLHENKLEIHCTRTIKSFESANRLKQQKRKPQPTKNDDPQIPQPDLRFASGNSEANGRNKAKTTKRGQSPNKNTHRIDLPLDAVACPLHHYQKHAK